MKRVCGPADRSNVHMLNIFVIIMRPIFAQKCEKPINFNPFDNFSSNSMRKVKTETKLNNVLFTIKLDLL